GLEKLHLALKWLAHHFLPTDLLLGSQGAHHLFLGGAPDFLHLLAVCVPIWVFVKFAAGMPKIPRRSKRPILNFMKTVDLVGRQLKLDDDFGVKEYAGAASLPADLLESLLLRHVKNGGDRLGVS